MMLPDYIKTKREARGWHQRHLAERVGVTRSAISSWETGRCRPVADHVEPLALALGVDVDEVRALVVDPVTRTLAPMGERPGPTARTGEGTASIAGIELDGVRWVSVDEDSRPRPLFRVEDVRQWLGTKTATADLVRGMPAQHAVLVNVDDCTVAVWHVSIAGLQLLAARSRSDADKVMALLTWAADVLERVALGRPVQPEPASTLPADLASDPIISIRMKQIEVERRVAAVEAETQQIRGELVRHQLAEEQRRQRQAEILAGGHASVAANDLPDVPIRRLVWDLTRKVTAHKVGEKTREYLRRYGMKPEKEQLRAIGQEAGTETWNPICEAVLTRCGVNLRVRRDNLRQRGESVTLLDVAEAAGLMVELYDIARELWADWWIERGAA